MKKTVRYLKKRKIAAFSIVGASALLNLSFQNCAPAVTKFSQVGEVTLAKQSVLDNTGTSATQNLCRAFLQEHDVVDCGADVTLPDGTKKNRKEYEKEQAFLAAAADPEHVVVAEFQNYFGTKMDILAQAARYKSVTSKDRGYFVDQSGKSFSPISMAGKDSSGTDYYKGDHTELKQKYESGKLCYYGTLKVDAPLVQDKIPGGGYSDYLASVPRQHGSLPGQDPVHAIQYLVTGYCANCATNKDIYGPGSYAAGAVPHRLFGPLPHAEALYKDGQITTLVQPQMVSVSVADWRGPHIGLDTASESIIRVAEGTERGAEKTLRTSDFLNINTILLNADTVARNISEPYVTADGLSFSGISAAYQQIANLCSTDIAGVTLATQYTPIVVDLGELNIQTTGISDGVSFDLSGSGKKVRTAWLGGNVKTEDAVSRTGQSFKRYVTTEASDGFLVIPDANGQVTSGKQLFGPALEYNGVKYGNRNGYIALMSLAHKDCRSTDLRKKALGPWDGDLYNNVVKVWVDRNINGVSDDGEILSLRDAGVAAISACYTDKFGAQDSYGNSTALRSLMVYQQPMAASDEQIVARLQEKDVSITTGAPIELRISIDVHFNAK